MTNRKRWPFKLTAVVAVVVAVLETRAGKPFDYRFVSLITTSGILMFPGVVSIATSYWLWRGTSWAYVACLLSTSALMLYLGLLIYMKTQVPDGSTAAGDEVYFVTGAASAYLIVLLGAFSWLHRSRIPEPSIA